MWMMTTRIAVITLVMITNGFLACLGIQFGCLPVVITLAAGATVTKTAKLHIHCQLSPYGHCIGCKLWFCRCTAKTTFASQTPKCRSKIYAIKCIYKWIYGTIKPAQPCKHIAQSTTDLMLSQEWRDEIVYEKRQPACYETAHHNTQGLRSLVFFFQ